MENEQQKRHLSVVGALLLLAGLGPVHGVLAASPAIGPGQLIYLDQAVRGGIECFIGFSPNDCTQARWNPPGRPTEFSVNEDLIRGTFAPPVQVGLGQDNRAIAWLEYEFFLAGSGGLVEAEIAVKYDLVARLSGTAAYASNTLLTMTLTDITDPNEAFLASTTLWDGNRQGDQGLTDITLGTEHHIFEGEVTSLAVTLRRGVEYRVRIAAQASGSILLAGDVTAMTEASVRYLRIQVDEDEFAQVEVHDLDIKSAIGTHDAHISSQLAAHDIDLKSQLATHDADIKALLGNIQETVNENQRLIKVFTRRQLEVMRLLITPNGRREINEDALTCVGDDCPEFPAAQPCLNGSLKWNCRR